MKTAMQELIEIISHEQDHKKAGSEEWFALSHLKIEAEKLLEKEKQQIVEAFNGGYNTPHGEKCAQSGDDYYIETYK